jgi:hypothetical protein
VTLLIIADDEYAERNVPESSADLLISCGDLADETILSIAGKCSCREILAVKGNHDSSGPFSTPIRDLHLATFVFRGVKFGGFYGSWKYKPNGNYLFEHYEVASVDLVVVVVDEAWGVVCDEDVNRWKAHSTHISLTTSQNSSSMDTSTKIANPWPTTHA